MAQDDKQLFLIRRDFSAGENSRQHASIVGENQAEVLENWDIGIAGQTTKINGLTLVEDLSTDAGTGLFGFEPIGGTNVLVATHGQKLETWTGTGTFTEQKTDFTTNLSTTMIKCGESGIGDVFLASNGTDSVFRFDPADYDAPQNLANDNTSPPYTTVMLYYRNRVWALKDNLLYFSDAYPADYALAFDRTTNAFKIPVGAERALIGLRDLGIIIIGQDQVWGLNPTLTPAPTTDKPEKILEIGCVASNTAVMVGDDVYFLSKDGVRGVFRTQQDKLQGGASYPLSFALKTRFEAISWGSITKACAVYFDNKYFLSLPVDASTYNNEVWVYYPASQAWCVIPDWNVAKFATVAISGEQRLYAIDSTDGLVYRAWYGNDNNGTDITSVAAGREEDFGQPLVTKVGGEIEIQAEVAGSGNSLLVEVALDGLNYQTLGTIDLSSSTAPILPIDLPFTLTDSYIVREKLHLESLGRFRTIQIRVTNSDDNTDPIIFYGYNIVTFAEEYENE